MQRTRKPMLDKLYEYRYNPDAREHKIEEFKLAGWLANQKIKYKRIDDGTLEVRINVDYYLMIELKRTPGSCLYSMVCHSIQNMPGKSTTYCAEWRGYSWNELIHDISDAFMEFEGERLVEARVMSNFKKDHGTFVFDMDQILKDIRTIDEVKRAYFSWETNVDENRIKVLLSNGYVIYVDEIGGSDGGEAMIRTALIDNHFDGDCVDLFKASSEDEALNDVKEAVAIAYNGDPAIR